MQTESVLQTKNWSRPAKNRFSVALAGGIIIRIAHATARNKFDNMGMVI